MSRLLQEKKSHAKTRVEIVHVKYLPANPWYVILFHCIVLLGFKLTL
jgi:hypothetical protein